jgi:hypothetical protein
MRPHNNKKDRKDQIQKGNEAKEYARKEPYKKL